MHQASTWTGQFIRTNTLVFLMWYYRQLFSNCRNGVRISWGQFKTSEHVVNSVDILAVNLICRQTVIYIFTVIIYLNYTTCYHHYNYHDYCRCSYSHSFYQYYFYYVVITTITLILISLSWQLAISFLFSMSLSLLLPLRPKTCTRLIVISITNNIVCC